MKMVRLRVISYWLGIVLLFWVFDALLDDLLFHDGTFLQTVLTDVEADDLWARLFVISSFLVFGWLNYRLLARSRHSEEQLRRSRDDFGALFESASDGAVICRLDGRIERTNRALQQMLGYQPEELRRLKFWELSPESWRSADRAALENLLAGERMEPFEKELRARSGRLVPVSVNGWIIRDGQGRPERFGGFIRDLTGRKEAARRFVESESRFHELFDNLNSGAVVYRTTAGQDFTIIDFNKGAERIEGIGRERVLGRRVEEVFPEVGKVGFPELLGRVWRSGLPERMLFEIPGQAGEVVGWRDNFVFRLPSGEVVTVYEDITKRVLAEQALQERERDFRTVFDSAADAVFIMDIEGRFIEVNQVACSRLGYHREELLRMGMREIDSPRFSHLIQERKQLLLAVGCSFVETAHVARDGSEIPTEISSALVEFSGRPAVMAVARDLTERYKAEEIRRESERRYRTLFETSPLPIRLSDDQGKIIDVNRAWEQLTGYSREEAVGSDLSSLYHDAGELERMLANLRDQGALRDFEMQVSRKDGSCRDCLIATAPHLGPDGRIEYYQSFIHDITERKQLQSQFLQAQKMESVGRLAGGIAHDFNNLLTAIIGYTDMLLLESDPAGQLHADLWEIQTTAGRAVELTRQLLAFSRRQVIEPRVVNLNSILSGTNKMVRRLIGEDIHLVTSAAADLWPVRVDPGQLEQVLVNLVINARDAMPAGGRLTLETANVFLDEEYSRQHAEVETGEYVMLAVTDTGVGMDEEILRKVFEPFFTTKEHGKGTGLGLCTCYGIVRQHGGHIWIDSEPGRGTTVKVYLPRCEGNPEHLEAKSEGAMPRGLENILLVEDEANLRRMVVRLLQNAGYTLFEAADGQQALQLVRGMAPGQLQLMITDVVMPKLGGRELAGEVMKTHPGIRVLYVSGYTQNSIVHNGVLEEGIDFLQKPFTPDVLGRKVRELLDRPA